MFDPINLIPLVAIVLIIAILLGFKMNRKWLKKLWIVVWILFALSHVFIPIVYFWGADEAAESVIWAKDWLAPRNLIQVL
jgi:hypothetical protein